MWYVIQTVTGKERELVDMIKKTADRKTYEDCFVIQSEEVWRIGGICKVHIEPLFSSYVFVETDTPDALFYELKRIPRFTKLVTDQNTNRKRNVNSGDVMEFLAVRKEETELLKQMIQNDPDYIVRRSAVKTDENGTILEADGVLGQYLNHIVKKKLRKRSVTIEIPFLGEKKQIRLGIKLEGE